MKIALYIDEGVEQIVLTPETDTEKGIIGKLHDGTRDMAILKGEFYQCHGGWVRQGSSQKSTIVRLTRKASPTPPVQGEG